MTIHLSIFPDNRTGILISRIKGMDPAYALDEIFNPKLRRR
jgi:hypothetical protein